MASIARPSAFERAQSVIDGLATLGNLHELPGANEEFDVGFDASGRDMILCPFVYADGSVCHGVIDSIAAPDANVTWSLSEDAVWICTIGGAAV